MEASKVEHNEINISVSQEYDIHTSETKLTCEEMQKFENNVLDLINRDECPIDFMKNSFDTNIPPLSSDLIDFLSEKYIKEEKIRSRELIELLLNSCKENFRSIIHDNDILSFIINDIPNSFYIINNILTKEEDDHYFRSYFLYSGGPYYMAFYSDKPEFQKVICSILSHIANEEMHLYNEELIRSYDLSFEEDEQSWPRLNLENLLENMIRADEETISCFLSCLEPMYMVPAALQTYLYRFTLKYICHLLRDEKFRFQTIKLIRNGCLCGIFSLFSNNDIEETVINHIILLLKNSDTPKDVIICCLRIAESVINPHYKREHEKKMIRENIIVELVRMGLNGTVDIKGIVVDIFCKYIRNTERVNADGLKRLCTLGAIRVLYSYIIIQDYKIDCLPDIYHSFGKLFSIFTEENMDINEILTSEEIQELRVILEDTPDNLHCKIEASKLLGCLLALTCV